MSRWNRLAMLPAVLMLALAVAGDSRLHANSVRTPSRFLPGDAAIAAVARDQTSPFLCQGGATMLAVWSDDRANSTGGYEGETSRDIYGMRFDDSGTPLESVPFPVAAGPARQELPRAAWNGAHWLVVFESYDLGGTGFYYQKSLAAVRVAPDGSVIDPKPIPIYGVTPTGGTWAVASDGMNWVIAIQGTSASNDIVALRVSADGIVLDAAPRSLVAGTYYLRGGLHLAHASGVFLLAYEEALTGSSATSAIRFDEALDPLDAAPYTLIETPLRDLASNGSDLYAVWNQQLPDFSTAVFGTRIGANGQKLDGDGVNVSGVNPPQAYSTTAVAWDGGNWKVTWGTTAGTRIARIGPAGNVLDPGGVFVAGPAAGPSASAGNGSLQIGWTEFAANNYDVFTSHVDAGLVAGSNRAVSVGAPSQLEVDLAAGGSGFLAVYRSGTAGRGRILAQALDAAGNPLTSEPVELDSADSSTQPGAPAVAWNGSMFLVTWANASGVVARRLGPDGTPFDATPVVVLAPGFGGVDVEALGDTFLVVGLRCGINCQYVFPIASRVRGTDGAVLDPSPITMGGVFCSSPRLAALGGRWLLVWQANATHDDSAASTLGTFIDANGGKLPDFTVHGSYSTGGGNGIFRIGLAASSELALMVQSQELTSGVENDLLGRWIHPDGTVDPYFNLTPWDGNQYRPRVAWNGEHFVVVFQDQKVRLTEHSLEQLDARSDLVGMRILPGGGVVDPQGFVFSNSPYGEAYPNVVTADGKTLIAGSLVRNESPLANYRVGYDLFGVDGNAWPVVSASAAPSGGDVPLSVSFTSTGSTDPDGALAARVWDFGDGATSTEPDPTHLYTVGGPYVATLTVTDDGGAQSLQQVLVKATEPNRLPVAVASQNVDSGPRPLDVVFSAAGSYDPDGFLGNIRWTFPDGGTYWGATAYHTFYEAGTWQVELTVFDSRNGTGTDSLSVTVGPALAPAAPSGLSAIAFTTDWINMTWTDNSNSENGFKVERCAGTAAVCDANPAGWTQIAQVAASINYYGDTGLPSGTTFSYRVRAFNETAESASSATSTATTLSAPPVAALVPSVLRGSAPLPVRFDGSGSSGAIVSWNWGFSDGTAASGPIVNHTFVAAGTHTAILTVTDTAGRTGTGQVSIDVVQGGTRATAGGEGSTSVGGVSAGTYVDTWSQDDVAQVLLEVRTSGSPSTRQSQLEHTWLLDAPPGGFHMFVLDAWHSPNAEGDDFVFEYSRDGLSWTPMITVTKTADDDVLQIHVFAEDVTGPMQVRVRDLDRTPGHGQTDTLSVDEMFVMASYSTGYAGEVAGGPVAEPTGASLLLSKSAGGNLRLEWGSSCSPTDDDYAVYEGPLGDFTAHVPVLCSTGGATNATIPGSEGDRYYLIVPTDGFYEGRYGRASSGEEILAGPTRCYPAAPSTGCP